MAEYKGVNHKRHTDVRSDGERCKFSGAAFAYYVLFMQFLNESERISTCERRPGRNLTLQIYQKGGNYSFLPTPLYPTIST
jgi:hypothetical protein